MNNITELIENKGISPKKASVHKGGDYHSPCPKGIAMIDFMFGRSKMKAMVLFGVDVAELEETTFNS